MPEEISGSQLAYWARLKEEREEAEQIEKLCEMLEKSPLIQKLIKKNIELEERINKLDY